MYTKFLHFIWNIHTHIFGFWRKNLRKEVRSIKNATKTNRPVINIPWLTLWPILEDTTGSGRTSIITRVKLQVANPMCFSAMFYITAPRPDIWRRHPFSLVENKRLERLFLTHISEYTVVVTLESSVSHDLQTRIRTSAFSNNVRVTRVRNFQLSILHQISE